MRLGVPLCFLPLIELLSLHQPSISSLHLCLLNRDGNSHFHLSFIPSHYLFKLGQTEFNEIALFLSTFDLKMTCISSAWVYLQAIAVYIRSLFIARVVFASGLLDVCGGINNPSASFAIFIY